MMLRFNHPLRSWQWRFDERAPWIMIGPDMARRMYDLGCYFVLVKGA